jgi:hypothetical protein
MKRHTAPSVLLFLLATALGQAQPSTGSLAGRVLAATKDGNSKPARLADVFLAAGDDQVTVQQNLDEALAKRAADIKNNTDARGACLLASISVHEALKVGSSIRTFNTDEEGSFDVSKLKPGTYTIVVMGIANGYQCVWCLTTTVTAGKRQKVKLSEPVLACE